MTTSQDDYKQNLISKAGFRGKINANCIACSYDTIDAGSWRKLLRVLMFFVLCKTNNIKQYKIKKLTTVNRNELSNSFSRDNYNLILLKSGGFLLHIRNRP
jgi:hypothetical protein